MKRRLYITALITSPIIAIYDTSPLYIFNIINFNNFLLQFVILTIDVFLFWLVHIVFERKFPKQNLFLRYVFTCLIIIAIRGLTFISTPNSPLMGTHTYLAYPIITYLALNALIMIMVQSIVTGYKKAEAENQIQELKWQNTESQKQVLMQQLQPHFLFNALSILKSLIKENSEQAEAYIIKLSDFLRYTVESQNQQLVPVKKELQFIYDYINLQKVRYGEAFSYTIDISEEVQKKNIPVLAMQILVENIFKHNNFTEKKPLHFSITGSSDRIIVWNEKTSVRQSEKNNTGLANLNARYMLTCNKNIEVTDKENEFIVTIPLIN